MIFRIDTNHPKPVYQQLIDQVKFAVASGRLRPGDRLPPIRDVAVQVRVNRNTVARVYAELEREGILNTKAGQGAFVSDRGSQLSRAEQRRQLLNQMNELLAQASLYGLTREQVQSLFAERLNVVFPESQESLPSGGKR